MENNPIYTIGFDLFCLSVWLIASIGCVVGANSNSQISKPQRLLISIAPTIIWALFIAGKLTIRWLYV